MKKTNSKSERSNLIALFDKNEYDLEQFKGMSVKALRECAEDEGILKAPVNAKQAVKAVRTSVAKLITSMTLSEATKAVADGEITKIPFTNGTRAFNCHRRDDMKVAPDANIAWQAHGNAEHFNLVLREVCKAVATLKGKEGIPKSAKEFVITDHVKKGGGFEGPYFKAGNFIYREHNGNPDLTCAFPVSVLNKYFGASVK